MDDSAAGLAVVVVDVAVAASAIVFPVIAHNRNISKHVTALLLLKFIVVLDLALVK